MLGKGHQLDHPMDQWVWETYWAYNLSPNGRAFKYLLESLDLGLLGGGSTFCRIRAKLLDPGMQTVGGQHPAAALWSRKLPRQVDH